MEFTLRLLPRDTFPGNGSILWLLLGFTRLFCRLFIHSLRLFRSVIIGNVHHRIRLPYRKSMFRFLQRRLAIVLARAPLISGVSNQANHCFDSRTTPSSRHLLQCLFLRIRRRRVVARYPLYEDVNQLLVSLRIGPLCYSSRKAGKSQSTISIDQWMEFLHQGHFLMLTMALEPAPE